AGESDWNEYSNPIDFDQAGEYEIEYRATDDMGNTSDVKKATFTVEIVEDNDPPTATAEVTGAEDQRGFFVLGATLNLSADDGEEGTGVASIEYRVNGGNWQTYNNPVSFNDPGVYTVDYRATDLLDNRPEPETITFRVINGRGCVTHSAPNPELSDEFDGTEIDSKWLRHTRNGGTPTTGDKAPRIEDGQLIIPTHDFELDGNNPQTATGPVNFLGLDLPSLGDEWQVETQFTIEHTGGWQHAGLIVWQGDNNFFRSTITNSLSAGQRTIYIESSKDNPGSAE